MAYKGNISKKYPSSSQYEEGFSKEVNNHIKIKGANPHGTTAAQVGAAEKVHDHGEATAEKGGFLSPEMLAVLLASVSRDTLDEILSAYFDKGDITTNYFNKQEINSLIDGVRVIVDETYSSNSKNAQSGEAVAQAITEEAAKIIGSSAGALNTLSKLSKALGDDPDFATTVMTEIGKKANSADVYSKLVMDSKLSGKVDVGAVLTPTETEAMFLRYNSQVNKEVDRKIAVSEANISATISEFEENANDIAERTETSANVAKSAADNAESAASSALNSAEKVEKKLEDVYIKDDTYSFEAINEMFGNVVQIEFDIRNFIKSKQFLGKLEITENSVKLYDGSMLMLVMNFGGFTKMKFYAKSGTATVSIDGEDVDIDIGNSAYYDELCPLTIDKPFTIKSTEECEIVFVDVESDFLELKNEAQELHTAIRLSELSSNGHGIIDGNRVIFSISGTHTLNFSGMVDFEIDTGIASGDEHEVVIFVDDVVIKRVSGSDEKIETVKYKGVVTECIEISSSLGTTITFLKMDEVNYKGGRVKAEDFKEFVYMKERLPYYEQNLQDVGLLKVPANAKYVKTSFSTLNSDGKISLTNASISRNSVVCSGNETSLARAEFAVTGSIIAEIYSDTSNTDSYLEIDGKKVSNVGTSTEPLYFKGEVSDYMAIVSQINGERISFKNGIEVRELNGGILKSEDFGLLLDTAYNQGKHEKNLQNPHAITPEQIGALTEEQTEALIRSKVAELVDSAPEALDTLVELAKALGDDPNFATTIMQALGEKANAKDVYTSAQTDTAINKAVKGKANAVDVEKALAEKANNSEVNEVLGKKADKNEASNALKGYVSGKVITMNDVSPIKHKLGVKIRNKNLLPLTFSGGVSVSNGLTFTPTEDGGLNITGTPTAASSYYFANKLRLTPATYTFSGTDKLNVANCIITMYARDVDAATTISSYAISETKTGGYTTFTIEEEKDVAVYFVVNSIAENVVFNGYIYPQVEVGTEPTEYTPYVADLSTVGVNKMGKNLFNNDTSLIKEITYASKSSLSNTRNGHAFDLPAGTYTLSYVDKGLVGTEYIYTVVNDKDGNYRDDAIFNADGTPKTNNHIIAGTRNYAPLIYKVKDGDVICIYNGATNNIPVTQGLFSKVDFQLEVGETATEYEAYIEQATYTSDTEGNVIIPSSYPYMTLFADRDNVVIEAEYNKDLNKVFGSIDSALDAILAIQEGHAATSVAVETEGGDQA